MTTERFLWCYWWLAIGCRGAWRYHNGDNWLVVVRAVRLAAVHHQELITLPAPHTHNLPAGDNATRSVYLPRLAPLPQCRRDNLDTGAGRDGGCLPWPSCFGLFRAYKGLMDFAHWASSMVLYSRQEWTSALNSDITELAFSFSNSQYPTHHHHGRFHSSFFLFSKVEVVGHQA